MSDRIEFEEDRAAYGGSQRIGSSPAGTEGYTPRSVSGGGLAGWLVKHGIAKSEKSAQFVMVGIIVANIVLIYLIVKLFV